MDRLRVAVIDDTQGLAMGAADWSRLDGIAEIERFSSPFADETEAAEALAPFDVIVPMRERTAFTASLVSRLPRLRLLAMTGRRASSFDFDALTGAGVLVCNTGLDSAASTAELAMGLMLSAARNIARADAGLRNGRWLEDLPIGFALAGRRLGILGLGTIGSRLAAFGRALDMDVVAWSPNLTVAEARDKGARRVDKEELFAASDVVSLHLVLSARSRGIVGRAEFAAMKPGAIFVNTARAGLVDETALLDALVTGRIRAGLDVYDSEPLPPDHPLRTLPNVVLTPHLGGNTMAVVERFYRESVENIAAFAAGEPIRMVNPQAWEARSS